MKRIIILLGIFTIFTVVLPAQTSREDLMIVNRMMRLRMDNFIPLRFTNALDGKAVDGAKIDITGIGIFTTDKDGIAAFPKHDDGIYTLSFSKNGFISFQMEIKVKLNNIYNNRISVSPVMRGDYLRIVLDWGQRPLDLDIHLIKECGYHISYRDMHNAADGSVTLDRDAMNGFGPETITIIETDLYAVYQLFIHDYTNRNNSSSNELSNSGATVRVYNRNGLIEMFSVPESLDEVQWNVFKIVNGQITQ
ncbi:MAG: hypothetical protein FWB77_02075 [Treponema sp.]|nr:hypothetical protein [Treponema sp.]